MDQPLATDPNPADVLVREADHRIAGSLQVVAALLRRQSRKADPALRAALKDAERRIGVIGRLHRQLSLCDHSGTIELDVYLHSLGDEIRDALLDSTATLLINADPLVVPARTAVTIGMIAHELILNALKHAFGESGGVIQISCGANARGAITLQVVDDGVGATSMAAAGSGGIGSQILASLVAELGTRLVIEDARPGLRCTVVIPAQN